MKNFYENLPGFSNFDDLLRDENFFQVPKDWSVVLTDVKGSTEAIKEGRYKEVNTIGAASIVAAREAMGGEELPFVFGGDGATFLVPPGKLEKVQNALCALKKISETKFKLSLRIGSCKVSEIYDEGKNIEIAKYEMVKGRSVAIFRGNGITLAEKMIKSGSQFEVFPSGDETLNLSKLSCRWHPIPSKRGKVLSLLVMSASENLDVYHKVLSKLSEIFSEGPDSINPINLDSMTYKSFSQIVADEKKLNTSFFSPSTWYRFTETLVCLGIFKLQIVPQFLFKRSAYTNSMKTHSDYRKFDDMLRMIIDSSAEESKKLRDYLEELHRQGEIFFGLFESDNSLMTCYVMDGTNDGEHIHFVDGDNGGYAMAAMELKKQIQAKVVLDEKDPV